MTAPQEQLTFWPRAGIVERARARPKTWQNEQLEASQTGFMFIMCYSSESAALVLHIAWTKPQQ